MASHAPLEPNSSSATGSLPGIKGESFNYEFAGKSYPVINFGRVDWSLSANVIQYIQRDTLKPDPENGRTSVQKSELESLVASIKSVGIHTDLKVRRGESGDPILIGGHKRLAGAVMAGLEYLPCKIFPDQMSQFQIHSLRVLDNEHRTDIPPVDRAREYQRLLDASKTEGQPLTVDTLASHLSVSSPLIYQYLRLLKLPIEVQNHVNTLRIPVDFAQQLLTLNEGTPKATADRQIELGRAFIAGKLKTLGTGLRPHTSTRPDTSGKANKVYIHQRTIAVDENTTVMIGSRTPLTDEQVSSVLNKAQQKLVLPIHGHKPE